MRIAITGYASLDHVAVLDGIPGPGRTTTILDRPDGAWPRLGGSPAFVAAALVRNGIPQAYPVSWIGDDEAGGTYRSQLEHNGVPAEGLEAVPGARTPVAILAYEPQGGCICLYHPGVPEGLRLSGNQKHVLQQADWICVTVGPPVATQGVLDIVRDDQKLAWVVKHDPRAMSPELASRLAGRADLICHSQAESEFLKTAVEASGNRRPGQIVIETRGGNGASFRRAGESIFVASEPLSVTDPTGAGDTFAGGVLAALAKGETEPAAIVQAGHDAARALLGARCRQTESA